MADNVRVTLSSERVVVGPGEKAEVTAEIQNVSNIVEVFSVEVEGPGAGWISLSVSSFSLFPGDKETVHLHLAPPLASASKAGTYTIAVKVASKRDPSVMATAHLALDVGKISTYELDLSPKKVRARKGFFEVVIVNTGNITNTYKLEASDPEEMCIYDFKSDTVAIEAGATAKVGLSVSPKNKPLVGAAKMFSFTVKAIPVASEVKKVEGQLECPPLLPKWAIAAVALAAVAIVVVVVVLVSGGGGSSPTKPAVSPTPAATPTRTLATPTKPAVSSTPAATPTRTLATPTKPAVSPTPTPTPMHTPIRIIPLPITIPPIIR